MRRSEKSEQERPRGCTLSLQKQDLKRACAALEEIETDLVFELVEAYQERRSEDFGNALTLLKDLVELRRTVCRGLSR